MSLKYLHLLHPQDVLLPDFDSWLLETKEVMVGCPKWDGCEIREIIYDAQGGFNAQSAADKILGALGPVVIVPNAQTKACVELARKIGHRTVIRTMPVGNSTCLWQLFEEAHDAFSCGEPQLPRSIVLAILLIQKLEKDHMWGGKNKGYMWAGDLPSGRGIPANCAGPMPNVVSQLFSHGILIRKVSQGKNKYALNPEIKPIIYEILRACSLESLPAVKRVLERDVQSLSARVLDCIRTY